MPNARYEAYQKATDHLNIATCEIAERFGLNTSDILLTVLYEAAALVLNIGDKGPPSQAEARDVEEALRWLSQCLAEAFVPLPLVRRDYH